jgi:hypothetical protein
VRRLVAFAVLCACASYDPATSTRSPANKEERRALVQHLAQHPARQARAWGDFRSTPFAERVRPATADVLDYLRKDNLNWGLSEIPRASTDAALEKDARAALASLPEVVRRRAEPVLVAVLIIEDLGSSAYSEMLRDGDRSVSGYIAVDRRVLDQPANAWASWRDSNPFAPDPGVRIEATLEPPESNDRMHAIRFIVLHELGHILAGTAIEPPPHRSFHGLDPEHVEEHPYSRLSWRAAPKLTTRFDAEFPERALVKFYMGPETKLPAARAAEIYRKLGATDLPSLYGATTDFDDFAEGFATYVHVVLDHEPYIVRVVEGGRETARFESCWGTERCAAKQKQLAALLPAN